MAAETEVLFIRGVREQTNLVPRVDGQFIVEINPSYEKGNLLADLNHINGTTEQVERVRIAGTDGGVLPVTAEDVGYSNTTSGLVGTDVQAAIDELAVRKYTTVQYTISASGWDTNGIYSFESVYPSTTYDILNILTNENTSDAARRAWIRADCGGYRSTNTIKAHGEVPEVDIIVELMVAPKVN